MSNYAPIVLVKLYDHLGTPRRRRRRGTFSNGSSSSSSSSSNSSSRRWRRISRRRRIRRGKSLSSRSDARHKHDKPQRKRPKSPDPNPKTFHPRPPNPKARNPKPLISHLRGHRKAPLSSRGGSWCGWNGEAVRSDPMPGHEALRKNGYIFTV